LVLGGLGWAPRPYAKNVTKMAINVSKGHCLSLRQAPI
jgi:hypothetical protein